MKCEGKVKFEFSTERKVSLCDVKNQTSVTRPQSLRPKCN